MLLAGNDGGGIHGWGGEDLLSKPFIFFYGNLGSNRHCEATTGQMITNPAPGMAVLPAALWINTGAFLGSRALPIPTN